MTPAATTAVASNAASLPAGYFQMTSRFSGSVDFATPVPSTSPRTTGQSSALAGDLATIAPTANDIMSTNLIRSIIQVQEILLCEFDRIELSGPLWHRVTSQLD